MDGASIDHIELAPAEKSNAVSEEETGSSSTGGDEQDLLRQDGQENILPPQSSTIMAASNTVNSILGSGIIAIPYAMKEGGFGFSIIMIIFVAMLTDYTLLLLITTGNLCGKNTYQDVGYAAFGRVGYYAVSFVQLMNPLIVMTSYNVIGADTLRKLIMALGSESVISSVLGNRLFLVAMLTVCISMPLSCIRHIANLGKFSFISVLTVIFTVIFVTVKYFTLGIHLSPVGDYLNFFNIGVLKGINVMALTYACHHNAFLIYRSLKNPEKQWPKTVHISISFSALMVLVVGIFGFLSFTDDTQGDLLENFCYSDIYADITRVVFTCTVMLTYPVECFVGREVLDNIFFSNKQPITLTRHISWTLLLLLVTFGLSSITDCLGIIIEINGVLTATNLAIILPTLFYMKLKPGPFLSRGTAIPALVFGFGILTAVAGISLVLDEIVTGQATRCSHGKEFTYCTADISLHNATTDCAKVVSQPYNAGCSNWLTVGVI